MWFRDKSKSKVDSSSQSLEILIHNIVLILIKTNLRTICSTSQPNTTLFSSENLVQSSIQSEWVVRRKEEENKKVTFNVEDLDESTKMR